MSDAADSFIARQLEREPGLRLMPAFLPPAQRDWLPAWVALLGELDEAIFEVSDPRVAQTKLAWWGEDLAAGTRAQHPLSRRLLALPAAQAIPATQWRTLAAAALQLASIDHAPADWAEAHARFTPLATGVAAIESQLLGAAVTATAVRELWQLQRGWLAVLQKRMERSVAPLPLQMPGLLDYPVHPLWQALADECATHFADRTPTTLHRAILQAVWWRRLAALRAGRAPAEVGESGALPLLWHSWRAARRAARAG